MSNPVANKTALVPFTVSSIMEAVKKDTVNIGPTVKITGKSLEDFEEYRITKEKNIPHPKPVIKIGQAPVAAAGNITPITAEGKGGKTALVSIILAGAVSTNGIIEGFPGISVEPNVSGQAVISIDTEQSESDQQYNVKTVLNLANIETTPSYFYSFNIRTLSLNEYREFTSSVCELSYKEHKWYSPNCFGWRGRLYKQCQR